MANAVARTEILVRVIVKGAPADRTGNIRIPIGGVQHVQMAGDMFGLTLFLIGGFGREHVAVIFGDDIGHLVRQAGHLLLRTQRRAFAIVAQFLFAKDKVVHRINVFEQFTVGDIPHPARGAGWVKFARQVIGTFIEIVAIKAFVDAHAPDDDRGVVPVAFDHGAGVFD